LSNYFKNLTKNNAKEPLVKILESFQFPFKGFLMKVGFLTIFPDIVNFLINNLSLIKRSKTFVDYCVVNIRDFSLDKHKTVDDYVFGSGKGMLLKFDVVFRAFESLLKNFYKPYVILPSPRGQTLNNFVIKDLANFDEIIFICPNYEGIDDRILRFVNEEVSIGDYCISSGELASFVILESLLRFKFDSLVDKNNVDEDSFNYMGFSCLIEPFQFTRPREVSIKIKNFNVNVVVDKIFFSGDHRAIKRQLLKNSIEQTIYKKPSLFKCFLNELSFKDRSFYRYYSSILFDAVLDSVIPS